MKIKEFGALFSYIIIILLIIVIILVIIALLFWGTGIIAEFLWETVPKFFNNILKPLHIISLFTFIFLLLICLPLSFINKLKKTLSYVFTISAFIFWLNAWVWSFLLCLSIWGALSVVIGFIILGIGIVPIAILACMFDGQWGVILQLIILISFGSLSKYYGSKLNQELLDYYL